MSYARAEFNFFKPEVKDISYEKIQKLVEKGNVVKLDEGGKKLITGLLSSFGITDLSAINLGKADDVSNAIVAAVTKSTIAGFLDAFDVDHSDWTDEDYNDTEKVTNAIRATFITIPRPVRRGEPGFRGTDDWTNPSRDTPMGTFDFGT